MDLYLKVRFARRGGMSEGAAASHFGISRASVKKIMGFSVPPRYPLAHARIRERGLSAHGSDQAVQA